MKKIHLFALIALSVLVLAGCKGKDPVPAEGQVAMEFENQINDIKMLLDTKYTNGSADTFSIVGLKYLISNVKLYNGGTLMYSEENSYHLLDHSDDASMSLVLDSVPFGEYDRIDFSVGVDAAHNTSGGTGGDLGTGNGLFWIGWGSYIFYRLDGYYHNGTSAALAYHIGGDSNYKSYSMDISASKLIPSEAGTSTVHVVADVNQIFENPYTIDISTIQNVAAAGTTMDSIGTNIGSGMFMVHHVHNP